MIDIAEIGGGHQKNFVRVLPVTPVNIYYLEGICCLNSNMMKRV
jgi:hypothetical protein